MPCEKNVGQQRQPDEEKNWERLFLALLTPALMGDPSPTTLLSGSFGFWPGLEHLQNFPVRAGKGQLAQLAQRTPASAGDRPGRPADEFDTKDFHRDPVARDRVPHLKERYNGEVRRAEKIFRELPGLELVPVQLGIREFPQTGVNHVVRTPADEDAPLLLDDEGRKSAPS